MRHFCTLFNSAYQFHARLLYESICEHESIDHLQFYFVCFDDDSLHYFEKADLKNVRLITLEALEDYMPQLRQVKPQRSMAEYFFTSTPAVCKYVMENFSVVEEIVYLDADLFFFQSPEMVFNEIGEASISIIPHRFNLLNYYKNIYGFYNVGWISFKRDQEGVACLNQWYGNNIEWCFDKLTLKRYADQKYLDRWRREFKNVRVIKNIGANVAPWNIANYRVTCKAGKIFVNDVPLLFYHFASLKLIDETYYTTISSYFSFVKQEVADLIYRPYILRLYRLGYKPRVSIRLNKGYVVKVMRKMIRHFYNDTIVVDK